MSGISELDEFGNPIDQNTNFIYSHNNQFQDINTMPIPISYPESSNETQFVYPQDNMGMPQMNQQQQQDSSFNQQQPVFMPTNQQQQNGSFGNQQPMFVPTNQQQPVFMPPNQQGSFGSVNQPIFMPTNQQQQPQYMPTNGGFYDPNQPMMQTNNSGLNQQQYMTTTTTTTTSNNSNSNSNTGQNQIYQPSLTTQQYQPTVKGEIKNVGSQAFPWEGIFARIALATGVVGICFCCCAAFILVAFSFTSLLLPKFTFTGFSPYLQLIFVVLTLPTMALGAVVLGTFKLPKIGMGTSIGV